MSCRVAIVGLQLLVWMKYKMALPIQDSIFIVTKSVGRNFVIDKFTGLKKFIILPVLDRALSSYPV